MPIACKFALAVNRIPCPELTTAGFACSLLITYYNRALLIEYCASGDKSKQKSDNLLLIIIIPACFTCPSWMTTGFPVQAPCVGGVPGEYKVWCSQRDLQRVVVFGGNRLELVPQGYQRVATSAFEFFECRVPKEFKNCSKRRCS